MPAELGLVIGAVIFLGAAATLGWAIFKVIKISMGDIDE